MVKIGTDILQRIADLCNWLTYDESLAVQNDYNAVVTVFMILKRTLFNTFGSHEITTHGGSAPLEKTVNDYIGWRDDGYKLADDFNDFIHSPDLKFNSDDDYYRLIGASNDILRLVYNVMGDMNVSVVKKEGC